MKQTVLKEILTDKGITQKELAVQLGLNECSMSNKMNGITDFTYTEVYLICKITGIENPFTVFLPKRNGMP